MLLPKIKKQVLLLGFSLLLALISKAQVLNDYRAVATGNWAALGTWQVYNGSAWVAAGAAPTSAANVITIQATFTVTVATAITVDQVVVNGTLVVSAARTLTIQNGAGTDLQINAGGVLTNNGSLVLNSSTNTIVSGTLSNTVTTGVITSNGTITNTNGTVTNNNTFNVNSGSIYQHNCTTIVGVIPTATWNAASTCEILATNNGLPTGLNQTFGNFSWNYTAQTANIDLNGTLGTPVSGVSTIAGDLNIISTGTAELRMKSTGSHSFAANDSIKITGGTLVLNAGTTAVSVTMSAKKGFYQTAGTLNLSSSTNSAGNGYFNAAYYFTHTGGTIQETGASTSSQISINGSTAAYIETPGFLTGSIIFFTIQETGGATTFINSAKTVVVNPGTTFVVNDNGTTAGDLTVNGTITMNTDTWDFTSGVTGVNGLFLNNFLTIGLSSTTGLVFNSAGTFRQNVNGGLVAIATWLPTSTLDIVGVTTCDSVGNGNQTFGNVIWNCPSQTSSAYIGRLSSTGNFTVQNNYTVTSTGTGTLRFPDFDFTIGNDLTVQNASKLQLSYGPGLYTPATITTTVTGNVNILNTALLTVGSPNTTAVVGGGNKARDYVLSLKKNFVHSSTTAMIGFIHRSFNLTLNDEQYRLTLDFNNGIKQYITQGTASAMAAVSGDGVANSGTDDEFDGYFPFKISVTNANTHLIALSDLKYNTLTVASTNTADTLDMTAGTYNLTQYPTLLVTGLAGAAATTISGNAAGSGVLDFGFGILTDGGGGSGTFTLAALAELKTKHVDGITPIASGAVGCIQTATRGYNAGANYTYNGNTPQNTGTGLANTLSGVLEIDNSTPLATGGVTLSKPVASTGTLALTNGKLITSSFLFTINSAGVVSPPGGSAVSFVDGPIKKVGFTAGTEFTFPTGDTAKWARIGFTVTTTNAALAYSAEYFKSDPHVNSLTASVADSTLDYATVKKISYQEYWQLIKTTGTGDGAVKLYWENPTFSGITSATATDLRVAHLRAPGIKWYGEGTTPTVTSGSIETQAVIAYTATYNYFTFGAPNAVNPLPVELLAFNGHATSTGNQLIWQTASEINNDYFDLEHSVDGETFSKIAQIDGHGNSTSLLEYENLHRNPAEGMNYYRLKQVDFDGHFDYSSVVAINNNNIGNNPSVLAYPNPTTENTITLALSNDISSIVVYNVLGEIVYQQDNLLNAGKTSLDVMSRGVYIVKAITADNSIVTTKFSKN